MADQAQTAAHWDAAYAQGDDTRSWYEEHRQQYLHTLDAATGPGAAAVFGCFAPDGPQHCSGLPVARYSAAQLARQLGAEWLLVGQDRQEHITPAGTIQPFSWVALRRQS